MASSLFPLTINKYDIPTDFYTLNLHSILVLLRTRTVRSVAIYTHLEYVFHFDSVQINGGHLVFPEPIPL